MRLEKSVISPVLVGRNDDLSALYGLLDQSRQGRGQTALISGEAGIGKSRVASTVAQQARLLGSNVIQGGCLETDRALPYAPMLDLFRGFEPAPAGAASTVSLAAALREIAPGSADPTGRELMLDRAPEQSRHRLFQALEQFLTRQSALPLLILIEDLHWSDDTSLEFLLQFSRHIRTKSIFLVLTFRSDEPSTGLGHFLAGMDRERLATEVVLTRLSASQVDSMLRAIFELDRPVRSEFMATLYALTGGNPFFIEEVLKSLILAGGIYYADGTWDRKPLDELNIPRSVKDAVSRSAERVSAEARDVLSVAAVIGQRFAFPLLQAVTRRSEAELIRSIRELLGVQLLVEEPAEGFAFRHALTREAIYSQLIEPERRTLHKRIGESIENLGQQAPGEQIANLAYHFYRANSWQKALEYSERAGMDARRLYAPRAAIEHLTHAVEAAHHLKTSTSPTVLQARGESFELLGDFDRARGDYEAACESAKLVDSPEMEWRSLLELGALWAGRDYAEAGRYYQLAHALAREQNNPEWIAHSLNRLGNWRVNIEQPLEGLQHHMAALEAFEGAGNSEGAAQTLDLLGMANYIHGDLVRSQQYYRQAVDLFRLSGQRQGLSASLASMLLNNARLQSGMAVLASTNREEARQACEEALALARGIGWRPGEAYALILLGNYLGIKGSCGEALQLLQASLAIAEEIDHHQWILYSHYCLGCLYFDFLAPTLAREHLETSLKLADQMGSSWWITNTTGILASTHILDHHNEQARAVLEAALHVSIDTDTLQSSEISPLTLGQRRCWFAVAELCLAAQDYGAALYVADRLIASAANIGAGGIIAPLWLLRGQALTALGRTAEAGAVLEQAQNDAEQEGERPLLWRIHVGRGRMHDAQGRREEAASAFASAAGLIAELCARIPEGEIRQNFAKRAEALMPKAQLPTAKQMAKREFGGLTDRERDVARLIARGKSNRDTATALVVSERTVETHVSSILSKLGFSSRAQIAAWAVEKGLLRDNET